MIHVSFISHIITIHTDAQVGPGLDEAQSPSITLSFKPTWGHSHIHSFYKSNVKYENDTRYKNIPLHRYQ